MFKLQISSIFNFDWAHQSWISGVLGVKAVSYQTLRHSQFLSKFQSLKFKFSSSGKWKVHMFEDMTNALVHSEKKLPLF